MAHGDKKLTKAEFIKEFPDEDPRACDCTEKSFKCNSYDQRIILPDHEDRIAELEKKIEKLST